MTYNHEQYIAKALEGCLMQETTFKFEVVIGDDFSTDNTLEICYDYQKRYPDIIRVLERPLNGAYDLKRKEIGRAYNYINTIENCRGQYIALLDGDDFWISPSKLQIQYDFLTHNPEYALCGTLFNSVYPDKKEKAEQTEEIIYPLFEDILFRNPFGTLTVVMRKSCFAFPDWIVNLPYFDWPLFALISSRNKTAILPQITANYRRHHDGYLTQLGYCKQQYNRIKILKTFFILFKDQISNGFRNILLKEIYEIQRDLLYQPNLKDTGISVQQLMPNVLINALRLGRIKDGFSLSKHILFQHLK